MTATWKNWRTLGVFALSAALVLACFLLLPAEQIQAAGCTDNSGGSTQSQWASTPEARVRTLAGDCPQGMVCQEWCINSCTGLEGTGFFSCFTP